MSCLKPSLINILFNRRMVEPERLKWALWYQFGRPQQACLSYSQVLIAFNDLSLWDLKRIREQWGPELDEEPIGQLLLDQGCISLSELLYAQELQKALPRHYLGHLLIEQGFTYPQEIEHLLKRPLFKRPYAPFEQKAVRLKALELLRYRLTMRDYLSYREITQLGLELFDVLPLSFKPLADLLVLNGDLPDYLVELMLVTPVPREADPLLALLTCHGYPPDVLLPRLDKDMLPGDQGKSLGILLIEKGFVSRQRLTNLILETTRCALPDTPALQGA